MKQNKTPFEKRLDVCINHASSLKYDLKTVRDLYRNQRFEDAYGFLLHVIKGMEQLNIFIRSLPSYTKRPGAKADVAWMVKEAAEVEIGYTEEGWFGMRFPVLLPGNEFETDLDIRRYLGPVLQDFFAKGTCLQYRDHVLVFCHMYDAERPEKKKRDPLNGEMKAICKMLSQYSGSSDFPYSCPFYHCSCAGEWERTELYLIPREELCKWIRMETIFPDEGMKIYDTLEKAEKARQRKNK